MRHSPAADARAVRCMLSAPRVKRSDTSALACAVPQSVAVGDGSTIEEEKMLGRSSAVAVPHSNKSIVPSRMLCESSLH